MVRQLGWGMRGAVVAAAVLGAGPAWGAGLSVAWSPGWDEATGTGCKGTLFVGVSNSGVACGNSLRYVNGVRVGGPVGWDASGAGVILNELGADATGSGDSHTRAINSQNLIAGDSVKYVNGISLGRRAVVWGASGTEMRELPPLGTDATGVGYAAAYGINDVGVMVGDSLKYVNQIRQSQVAVRWDAQGVITELDNLGTDAAGYTVCNAYAVNASGVAVGYGRKYDANLNQVGYRVVRWEASGKATELGNLGVDATGYTTCISFPFINDAGIVAGNMYKYINGMNKGIRAVRWEAGSTTPTELGTDGTDTAGHNNGLVSALNARGAAVGTSEKYVNGVYMGTSALRWDAGNATPVELGVLGTDANGKRAGRPYGLNEAGTVVGTCDAYVNGTYIGPRAVAWLPDASVIDLNTLGVRPVSAEGTWVLETAESLTADGWVGGEGNFDPDGVGPLAHYGRGWVGRLGLGGSWVNTSGVTNTWGKGANWSTGTPAIQLDATFDAAAEYTVGLDADAACRKVQVKAGVVHLGLGNYSLTAEQGVSITPGAKLAAGGVMVGNMINDGTFTPEGTARVVGDFSQSGRLELKLGAVQHDRLEVTGATHMAGNIGVVLAEGYVPAAGSVFDVLDWHGVLSDTARFDFSRAALPDGWRWDTSGFDASGQIGVVAPEPGTLGMLMLGVLGLSRRRRR